MEGPEQTPLSRSFTQSVIQSSSVSLRRPSMCVTLWENTERIGAPVYQLCCPHLPELIKATLASFQSLPLSLPEPSLSQCQGLCWSPLLPQGEATSLVFSVRHRSLEYQDCECAPPYLAQWLLGSEPWQQLPRPQAQIREEGRPPSAIRHTGLLRVDKSQTQSQKSQGALGFA